MDLWNIQFSFIKVSILIIVTFLNRNASAETSLLPDCPLLECTSNALNTSIDSMIEDEEDALAKILDLYSDLLKKKAVEKKIDNDEISVLSEVEDINSTESPPLNSETLYISITVKKGHFDQKRIYAGLKKELAFYKDFIIEIKEKLVTGDEEEEEEKVF